MLGVLWRAPSCPDCGNTTEHLALHCPENLEIQTKPSNATPDEEI